MSTVTRATIVDLLEADTSEILAIVRRLESAAVDCSTSVARLAFGIDAFDEKLLQAARRLVAIEARRARPA